LKTDMETDLKTDMEMDMKTVTVIKRDCSLCFKLTSGEVKLLLLGDQL
jgi:hypothetical protein